MALISNRKFDRAGRQLSMGRIWKMLISDEFSMLFKSEMKLTISLIRVTATTANYKLQTHARHN